MYRMCTFLLASFLVSVGLTAGEANPEALKERPRVFRGPYKDVVLDPFLYSPAYYSHSPVYFPLVSPLMYQPVIPGRSSVSFAVGSDGYRGIGFTTSERIKGTNVLFSLSASWEEGEYWWYPGYRYNRRLISPGFSWSNGNTSLYVGVDLSELSLEEKVSGRKAQPRVNRPVHLPEIPLTRDAGFELDADSVHVGISHRLGNIAELYFSASQDDWGEDHLSVGLRGRLYENRNGKGEWFPALSPR